MKAKYRRPPFRNCDRCGIVFRGWTILCNPCAKQLGSPERETESLRDFRKRVIDPQR